MAFSSFSSAPGEEAYEVFNGCNGRICNLGLIEAHTVNYTTFYWTW